ncbi:MAG: methyltransferase domain-containing protein [Ignavibacteriaceae bacterium]|nr:methyltransferase domain-containing protein [Ignavibacteriaceae bacterium]
MSLYKPNFWDERFSGEDFIYGTEPNQFFKEQIDKISAMGKLILPGEGEGRNAVYAASKGWNVDAFDQSKVAKQKALQLAQQQGLHINYTVTDITNFILEKNIYKAAAIIFVHLSPDERSELHKKLISSLLRGGIIIVELFSKNQFGKNSGGPQDLDMLSSLEDIKNDFKEMRTILLEEKNVILNEGNKHSGEASVIRFVGEKIE